jgi:hypothetical protein
MMEAIDEWTQAGLVAIRVTGRLEHQDYQRIVPRLEQAIAKYGTIHCLIDMIDVDGIAPRAIWDELKFDFQHARDVSRCAVVGDRSWERWATAAARPVFRRAEVRYFERADLDKALAWARADQPVPPAAP